MDETNKAKPEQTETNVKDKEGEQKRKTANDKLRQKLEKLKKDDPNIYPVF